MGCCFLGREEAEQLGSELFSPGHLVPALFFGGSLTKLLEKRSQTIAAWSGIHAGLMGFGQHVRAGADAGCWEGAG